MKYEDNKADGIFTDAFLHRAIRFAPLLPAPGQEALTEVAKSHLEANKRIASLNHALIDARSMLSDFGLSDYFLDCCLGPGVGVP